MRILKIIHGYPPLYNAGSEVYSQSICNELALGHQVTVFTREENPYKPDFTVRHEAQSRNLDLYIINMARGKDGFQHQQVDVAFARIATQVKPDIAHIGHLNHLSTGIVDVLNELKVPIVFTLHDFWLMCPRGQFLQRNFDGNSNHVLCDKQENSKCAEACYKMYHAPEGKYASSHMGYWTDWISVRMAETSSIVDKVDLFIAPSKYLMGRFISDFGLPEDKVVYLDYGFPTKYLTPTNGSKKVEPFTFGYIGTHIPAKGVNVLIEAFKKIKTETALKIWGHKDAQSTRALIQMAEEKQGKIEFKGEYVNKNLADEVFAQVDCIVVPSIWAENSPLVIHEAQACKIPVITANYGGMKEYVHHRQNGLLFEHRDNESLYEQMSWAINNPVEMQRYGNRGYLYDAEGKVPSIETHCETLTNLYQQVIKKYEKQSVAHNA